MYILKTKYDNFTVYQGMFTIGTGSRYTGILLINKPI